MLHFIQLYDILNRINRQGVFTPIDAVLDFKDGKNVLTLGTAAQNIGNVFSTKEKKKEIADLYASSIDSLPGLKKGTYFELDCYAISDKFYNLVMCDHNGPISNNDIKISYFIVLITYAIAVGTIFAALELRGMAKFLATLLLALLELLEFIKTKCAVVDVY